LLSRFRFVPEARLDDLMISWASDGGGVGPHLDSYDVFLLQVQGRRRWRIGRAHDRSLVAGLPVKILQNFEPEEEWVLEPGDMLYLPPLWGHDGIAEGECMTCSIGFRAPGAAEVAQELLQRVAEDIEVEAGVALYRDPPGAATAQPGFVPQALRGFAEQALAKALRNPRALDRALGEYLTEPKPQVWFEGGERLAPSGVGALRLDRRSRMMYDMHHVFINGEAFEAAGRDARLMRELADRRSLPAASVARLSGDARALVAEWLEAGWLHDD
jgi:50S ribosomal protein L16 3-hydroxylase